MALVFTMTKKLDLADDKLKFFTELGLIDCGLQNFREFIDQQKISVKNNFYRWMLSGFKSKLILQLEHPKLLKPVSIIFQVLGDYIQIGVEQNHSQTENVTDQKKIEFWESFKKCFSEGVFFTDTQGIVIEISDQTTMILPLVNAHGVLLNRDAIMGTSFGSHLDVETQEKMNSFMQNSLTNSLARFERIISYKERSIELKGYTLYDRNVPKGYMFLAFDVTKNMLLEKKLNETQDSVSKKSHLIVLGELAGKIAHEINSPLGAILLTATNGEFSAEKGDLEGCKKQFAMIEKTSIMIGEIIRNLLAFSRQEKLTIKAQPISIQNMLDEVVMVASIGLKSQKIDLRLKVDVDCIFDGKKTQIQQVFLNLISNSISAIKSLSEKWISVEVRDMGEAVQILVIDSGHGIPAEIADKMMNEYFSTKELGQSLGIGLSISKSIIQAHGGSFTLDRAHKNTCFKILLPKNKSANNAA